MCTWHIKKYSTEIRNAESSRIDHSAFYRNGRWHFCICVCVFFRFEWLQTHLYAYITYLHYFSLYTLNTVCIQISNEIPCWENTNVRCPSSAFKSPRYRSIYSSSSFCNSKASLSINLNKIDASLSNLELVHAEKCTCLHCVIFFSCHYTGDSAVAALY